MTVLSQHQLYVLKTICWFLMKYISSLHVIEFYRNRERDNIEPSKFLRGCRVAEMSTKFHKVLDCVCVVLFRSAVLVVCQTRPRDSSNAQNGVGGDWLRQLGAVLNIAARRTDPWRLRWPISVPCFFWNRPTLAKNTHTHVCWCRMDDAGGYWRIRVGRK